MSDQTWPLTEYGLPPSPLTREALQAQASRYRGSAITPASSGGGGAAAFTVTFADVAHAVAFATSITALGWTADSQLARHIADLTDPTTLTITGPATATVPADVAETSDPASAPDRDDTDTDGADGRRLYEVTVTETATYRIRVAAPSEEEAAEIAEDRFCHADDINVFFFSADDRDFTAELVTEAPARQPEQSAASASSEGSP